MGEPSAGNRFVRGPVGLNRPFLRRDHRGYWTVPIAQRPARGGWGRRDATRTLSANMPPQYIFTIENLGKAYGKKEVLKGIWLSFYPGAKIGVLGGNGSGKSTLLRIMAGVDTDFMGTAKLTEGYTVGHVPQEPQLDPTRDVRGNIEQAVAPIRELLT